MVQYHLADCIPDGEEYRIEVRRKIDQSEYEEMMQWFSFSGFYYTCQSIKAMTLESAADLENFLTSMRSSEGGFDDTKIDAILTTGNKLFIGFLSLMKIFVDVIGNAISEKSKDDLRAFQEFNSKLYDQFFGYRFFTRMRNYVVHYSMPLTSITDSISSGVTMSCSRDMLLAYRKWSAVQQELERLPEKIDIFPYIEEAKAAISALYLKALETIADQTVAASQKLVEICRQSDIQAPVLLIVDEDLHVPRIEKFPLHIVHAIIADLKEHPGYNIEIIPADER